MGDSSHLCEKVRSRDGEDGDETGDWYTGDGQAGGYAEGNGSNESRGRERQARVQLAGLGWDQRCQRARSARRASTGEVLAVCVCVYISRYVSSSWLDPLRKLESSTPVGVTAPHVGILLRKHQSSLTGMESLGEGTTARLQLKARLGPRCQGVGKQGRGGGLSRGTKVSLRELPLVESGTI